MRKLPLKRRYYRNIFLLSGFLFSVHFVWATALDFQKLALDFQQSAISDFVGFTTKGERYPLIHTISELRFRVFSEKLGVNRKAETKACSLHRTYGVTVPDAQKKFCEDYDTLVELAKTSIAQTSFFEKTVFRKWIFVTESWF